MISDDLLQWLDDTPDRGKLRHELDTLRAIKVWVLKEVIGFEPGDVVELVMAPDTDNGWHCYREALAPGAVADVHGVGFGGHHGYWYADIVLRREWTVDERETGVVRHWHGPADETPEGMEPPRAGTREMYPQGRRHSFAVRVGLLTKVTA